jgi:two-component system, cell cycle sensor histidine kinase and response regulator CckA
VSEPPTTGAAVPPGAIRRSQRIASQLHQLVATSITNTGALSEADLLRSIAARALSVFDADEALTSVVTRSATTLSARVRRGEVPVVGDDTHDGPYVSDAGVGPHVLGDWLCAPIFESWNRAQGIIAVRHADATGRAIDDGEILTLLAQMTASAIAEVRLRQGVHASEARWRALVDAAPIGIVESERDGTVLWWNKAASTILSWPSFEGAVAPVVEFPSALADALGELWTNTRRGQSLRGDLSASVSGRRRELRASVTSLEIAGDGHERLLTLLDDVTDEHEMQAELRVARGGEIRAQVASSVAHDFNNLLTLITGYSEMLASSLTDDSALDLVRDIQATTSRASQITQQLQTIGRTQVREASVIDVRRLVESNAEVIEHIVGANVSVSRDLMDAPNVLVDADQFEQVLLNLVINARDAMPTGGHLRLEVDTANLSEADATGPDGVTFVRLRVSDTGTGMDDETLARCFEPFFTTKGPFKGTGMGLASARRLVEASGGRIVASSVLGEGTTFEIVLPATSRVATQVATSASTASEGADATVLVAEDDDALRRLIVQVLRRAGYHVLEGENGAEAMAAARANDFDVDVVVGDVDMPVMGGVELVLTLQARLPSLVALIISGHAGASALEDLAPRSAAFLAKPFRPSELVDAVNDLLARQRTKGQRL